jgi:ParB family chromosome partitioning protein
MEIEITKIEPNPWNPRIDFEGAAMKELVDSIKRFGVLQPICARPHPTAKGKYQIVYGQRRWTACKKLKLKTILVREPIVTISDKEAIDMMGDENIKRQAYGPVELATYFETRRNVLGESEKTLAKKYGVDKSHVSRVLQLEKLPEEIKPKVSWGISTLARESAEKGVGLKPTPITFSHAREILRVPKKENQVKIAEKIEKEGLTVAQTKKEVEKALGIKPKPIEETATGDIWKCPICKKKFRLIHVSPTNAHRLEEMPT